MHQFRNDMTTNCSAIILAGGYSTRFGRDKPNAIWRGKSLIAHAADNLRGNLFEVIAVARPDQTLTQWPVDKIVYDDLNLPDGPLRGITAGLQACATPYAFVCACDAPGLRLSLIRVLLDTLHDESIAVIPTWGGSPQPLVGLYRIEAAPLFLSAMAEGCRSPRTALKQAPHQILPEDVCRQVDPQGLSFLNLNTQADLAILGEIWHDSA